MRLEDILNKFSNYDFLISVNDWCDEMGFWKFDDEKKRSTGAILKIKKCYQCLFYLLMKCQNFVLQLRSNLNPTWSGLSPGGKR